MIIVDNISKAYGAIQAVAGVSFQARGGEIMGLLGPNGAGKTTTLRLLTGLIRCDSGSMSIDGIDAIKDPQRARTRLAVLPDSHGLYPRLSARENIRYFARLRGVADEGLNRKIDDLLQQFDAAALANRRCAGFSQGERMKVNLARALIHDPPCLILDEPSNGLDVMSTRLLRRLLIGLRSAGKCVILSSHIMQEVGALCDTIVVIAKGRVVAQGTRQSILAAGSALDLEEAFVKLVGLADDDLPHTEVGQ